MDAESAPSGPDVIPSSAIMASATALGAAVLAVMAGDHIAPADVPAGAWLALAGFGTFTALAFRWFLAGTRRIGAARASLLSTVEPVYTIALASILLGETLSPVQLVGGALVIAGVILAETGPRAEPAVAAASGYRDDTLTG